MNSHLKSCPRCGKKTDTLVKIYEFRICNPCLSSLGLFTNKTILKHRKSYAIAHEKDSNHPTYEEAVKLKLAMLEREYITKKIKLLDIQEKLANMDEK